MVTTHECQETQTRLSAYVDRTLSDQECNEIEAHLRNCKSCRDSVRRFASVQRLLQGTFNAGTLSPAMKQKTGQRLLAVLAERPAPFLDIPAAAEPESFADRLRSGMGAAPWWGVSVALHVLVILLAGLISMSISLPGPEDAVVIVTELQPAPQVAQLEQTKEKLSEKSALSSKHETPPTDPTSKELSDIVVPPDILAKAELGDHFETINPDRPDTQSAFGNPDSHFFYSVKGCDEPEGGGGTGGNSLDDLIGVGGASSPGSGGGWGGGHGTGIGVGTGSGRGSFGNRNGGGRRLMVKRHGGSKATEGAVDAALRWLAYHQENEGFWDTDKYLDNKALRYGGSLDMSAKYDHGITGLATLAFLGAGHTLRVGEYRGNVQRAIAWLIAQQGADGDFTAKFKPCHKAVTFYCHCIATLACAEALGMNGSKDWGAAGSPGEAGKGGLRAAVEKGIDLILEWQKANTTGGWTYYDQQVTDPTVTGWAVMALKAAKTAGIKVPADAIMRAKDATAAITTVNKNKGDYGQALVGYLSPGAVPFNSKGYACTAAGMVINLFLGMDAHEDAVIAASGFITQDDALPAWVFKPQDVNTDHQNLYYWYYGTLGCFQVGGDAWKKWNEKMKQALVPNQRRDGDASGSWDPDDVWGAWGGRVYSTALGALCLEVYYRYTKLTGEK